MGGFCLTNTKEATMKTPKILSVNFPQNTEAFGSIKSGPSAGTIREELRYSGWDIKRDMARGTRSDTGRHISSQYAVRDARNNVQTRDTIQLYALEMDSYGNCDLSLLPPVASL